MYARKLRNQGGFSLVSLMVGLVISMLVGLTALGSLQTFTATQRQSAGVGTLLGAGSSTLGIIKYELSQAGRGLYHNGAPLCSAVNLSRESVVESDAQDLRPLDVSWDADGNMTLDIRYATALEVSTPVLLSGAVKQDGTAQLAGRLIVSAGDAVLLAPPEGTAGACTVRTVTAVAPATASQGQTLTFGPTGTHNKATFTTPVTYGDSSRVYLLGQLAHTRFRVQDGSLRMARPLQGQDIVLATGVRAFNVQMGAVNLVSGAIEDWITPHTQESDVAQWKDLTADRLAELRAMRLGLIFQSPQREKPDAQGNCSATLEADAPELFGDKLSVEGEGQCFKYRTFTGLIPLRNIQLGQAS